MGGTVCPPEVDILERQFCFGGVFMGSTGTVPFTLVNKTPTRTRVEFDLTRYKDFRLTFPGHESTEELTYTLMNPGMFSIELKVSPCGSQPSVGPDLSCVRAGGGGVSR